MIITGMFSSGVAAGFAGAVQLRPNRAKRDQEKARWWFCFLEQKIQGLLGAFQNGDVIIKLGFMELLDQEETIIGTIIHDQKSGGSKPATVAVNWKNRLL